jgi:hypothetical protein
MPVRVTVATPSPRATSSARTIFGELPELLIAISMSPERASRSSGSENTWSYARSLPVAVRSDESLKASARSRPFLAASVAIWLAMPALPPLPMI